MAATASINNMTGAYIFENYNFSMHNHNRKTKGVWMHVDRMIIRRKIVREYMAKGIHLGRAPKLSLSAHLDVLCAGSSSRFIQNQYGRHIYNSL